MTVWMVVWMTMGDVLDVDVDVGGGLYRLR